MDNIKFIFVDLLEWNMNIRTRILLVMKIESDMVTEMWKTNFNITFKQKRE